VGTIEPLSAALKVKNLEVIAEAYIFLFKEVNQEQRFSLSRL